MAEKAYSVSKINQYIKNMFLSDYALNHIYVKGEVSNLKYHTSGHIYFTLKDEKSQMACVMFSGQRSGLAFPMEEGQAVVVFGTISVYERDGKYQLYANEIRLEGAGDLYGKFLKLKERLEEEGIFAPEYKRAIPFYAKTVGIVTAATGAAIQDIIHISKRRNPYVQLILYPAAVQGEGAFETVVKGIHTLDQRGVDVIIVGRGGGSMEDLWTFNEEEVARAVFACQTPVISAVGHETDVTITDFAADLRAPTPSAAAELAVCDLRSLLQSLDGMERALSQSMDRILYQFRSEVERLGLELSKGNPKNQILQRKQFLAEIEYKLEASMKRSLLKKRHNLALLAERLKGLSPLDKLSQGYAFLENQEGEMIKSVSQIKAGDGLKISLADGEVSALVQDTIQVKRM